MFKNRITDELRALTASEMEFRPNQIGDGWMSGLIYMGARVPMQILDELVGPANWSREHYECKGNLYCRVGINVNYDKPDLEPRWVYKSDCGTESNTEKEKGESSDSFKRACVNWGIGRELYTNIPIFIKVETKPNGKGGWMLADKREKFFVKNVIIDKDIDKILYIEIANKNGQVVFTWKDEERKLNDTPQKHPVAIEEPSTNGSEVPETENGTMVPEPKKTRVKRQ